MESTITKEVIANTLEAFNKFTIVEVKVISAEGLQKTKCISSKMRPYAEVWISSKESTVGTPILSFGGQNPIFHHLLEVVCDKEVLFSNSAILNIEIFHRSSKRGKDKHLGKASICLVDESYNSQHSKVYTCPLTLKCGKQMGFVSFTMKLKQMAFICDPFSKM